MCISDILCLVYRHSEPAMFNQLFLFFSVSHEHLHMASRDRTITALKLISILEHLVGLHIIHSLSPTVFLLGLLLPRTSMNDLCLTSSLENTAVLAPLQAMVSLSIITQIIWPSSSISSSEKISFSHLLCNLLPGHSSTGQEGISRDISEALNPAQAFNNSYGQRSFSHTHTKKELGMSTLITSEPIPLFHSSNEYCI